MRTIGWDHDRDCVVMVDQTRLPVAYTDYHAETVDAVIESIKRLRVRGAPALGAAGAYGVALATRQTQADSLESLLAGVRREADRIATARPTAVNLARGVHEVMSALEGVDSITEARDVTLEVAESIADRDVARNKQLGANGATLVSDGDTVMTHCNAGALATVDWGTALGIVYSATEAGKRIRVIANETRPLNQGSRITTIELQGHDVPVTLIPDNASGLCMQQGMVDAVVVGADRIVLNGAGAFGDGAVFNKIGTYKQAVLADRHDIPFIVAAPQSTIDAETLAEDVEIEERDPDELRFIYGEPNAPADVEVYNPAFDATPMTLVDYLVTEDDVFPIPFEHKALLGTSPTIQA